MRFPTDEEFKADFGYVPCRKNWGGAEHCTCRRPTGHDGHCVCGCGARANWNGDWPHKAAPTDVRDLGEIPL